MRNLKRALSLVMAMALIVGMMVVSASAAGKDFTDADEIDHKEAVNVMTALNVISGKEDGSYYDPDGTLTRAEMAKIVAFVMNGGVEPNIGTKVIPTYSDIDDHWAEAYIEYCTSMGIINGDGAGKFNPQGTLTASQTAKMFLTAMGYNANVFGLVGNDWETNTNRYANEAGLYEDLGDVAVSDPISRDDAAQMAYNAIQATMMHRSWSQDMTTGQITEGYDLWVDGNGAIHTLMNEKFNADVYTGVMNSISYVSSSEKYTYTSTNQYTNNADSSDKEPSFTTTDDYTALQGEEVSVIIKNERNGDQTVLGIYSTGKSTVVTAPVSALEADGSKLKVNGTSYELENGLTTSLAVANSYNTIKLVDSDDNGKLDVAIPTVVTPGKVTYVSDTEIIAGGSTYKFEDDEIPSGLAKDDYVYATTKINGVNVITKLDAIEGTVTGEKSTDNLVEVNGTWYHKNGETMVLGSTYKFYAVNGVVVEDSVDTISGATISNLVMVLDRDNTTNVLNAQALILDATGTKSTVTIDKSGVSVAPGELYFYEETSAGYKFSAPTNTADGNYTWVAADKTVATTPSTSATIDGTDVADSAVIFVYTPADNNGAVITGKQLKSLTVADAVGRLDDESLGSFTSVVSGLTRVSYAGVALYAGSDIDDLGVTDGNTNYGYIISNGYQVKLDNDTYTTYDLWNGEENVTVYEKGTVANRAKGTVVKYDTIGADNIITGVSHYTVTNALTNGGDVTNIKEVAAIQGTEGDYIYLDGTNSANRVELTSDTKYLYIDSNASEATDIGKAGGEVVMADKYTDGNWWMDNVIVVTNASDEVVLLVVDVKNSMTVAANATLTASSSVTGPATVTFSKTSDIKKGDAIEVTITAGASGATGTITLNYARPVDVSQNTISVDLDANESMRVTIFAQGDGNISLTGALS